MNPDTTPTPRTDAAEVENPNFVKVVNANLSRELERELSEKTNEVARLRAAAQAVVDRWETPLWKDAEPTASVIYRLRDALAPAPEEPVSEIYGMTMDEWYGGYTKIESTEPANPTCANTTHKFSHFDCHEPVSLDSATKITREGNTDAKFKQLHEVASIIVEYIEDPDRRKHYRSEIQQLAPSQKDTSTETCPSQKDTDWRELGPDEVIQEGDEAWDGETWGSVDFWLGHKADNLAKVRTRRPWPKQEEMPLEDDDQIERLFEDEIDLIEKWGCSQDPIRSVHAQEAFVHVIHALRCLDNEILQHEDMFTTWIKATEDQRREIRYLRDEIQKLKKATPHANQ